MKKFTSFFWFCSGASHSLLKRCPTEAARFVSVGGAVFFTGLLAAVSGGFALYSVFNNYWVATLFGLLWGLMIFNLDRFLVSSLKKSENKWQEWLMASPRILLAVLIAIVVAKPLELRIFQPEIEAELVLIKEEQKTAEGAMIASRYSPLIAGYKAELSQLEAQIASKEIIRDDLAKLAQEEADGTGGSGRRNLGPIYAVKKANAERAETELKELKASHSDLISTLREKQDSVVLLQANEMAKIDVSHIGGLALQLEALARLANKYSSIAFANIFIMLLFVMIEASPLLVKLMSPRGPYDDLLEAHEHAFVNYRKSKVHRLDASLEKELAWKG
ncbi:DUF4407 domain-containing protein [uncultured Imperialibacter sp.]|uniref:DUF4407 domain-containing protein n=1 Tax=uncultured Imperialibacter sp. TaxID=1672639 RepID=UPI0030DC6D24|tara:strand:+ start:13556 stop:14554 length:999 start_codon:yes stop_codon:yes gene_type:complete